MSTQEEWPYGECVPDRYLEIHAKHPEQMLPEVRQKIEEHIAQCQVCRDFHGMHALPDNHPCFRHDDD